VNNTGTKYVRIMKQNAFWREKNGEYITFKILSNYICGINIFLLHYVYKMWITQEQIRLNYETNCVLKRKDEEYITCLKYSVPIFVE
jgi:hypothetical protein